MVSFRLVFFAATVAAMVHVSVDTAGDINLEGEQKLWIDEMQQGAVGQEDTAGDINLEGEQKLWIDEMQQGAVGQEKSRGLSDYTKDAWISSHNNFRRQHSACGLSWSTVLANNAQKVAEANARANRLQHSGSYTNNPSSGENLAMGFNTPLAVATAWHGEVADCDWSNGCQSSINSKPVGHFTAMVWKSSTLLGCGQALAGRLVFSACHYATSAPNIRGRYTTNVVPKSNAVPQCGGSNPPPTPTPPRRRRAPPTSSPPRRRAPVRRRRAPVRRRSAAACTVKEWGRCGHNFGCCVSGLSCEGNQWWKSCKKPWR